jgi:hypothetical protein
MVVCPAITEASREKVKKSTLAEKGKLIEVA